MGIAIWQVDFVHADIAHFGTVEIVLAGMKDLDCDERFPRFPSHLLPKQV